MTPAFVVVAAAHFKREREERECCCCCAVLLLCCAVLLLCCAGVRNGLKVCSLYTDIYIANNGERKRRNPRPAAKATFSQNLRKLIKNIGGVIDSDPTARIRWREGPRTACIHIATPLPELIANWNTRNQDNIPVPSQVDQANVQDRSHAPDSVPDMTAVQKLEFDRDFNNGVPGTIGALSEEEFKRRKAQVQMLELKMSKLQMEISDEEYKKRKAEIAADLKDPIPEDLTDQTAVVKKRSDKERMMKKKEALKKKRAEEEAARLAWVAEEKEKKKREEAEQKKREEDDEEEEEELAMGLASMDL
eukprot:COSAG02_NODE_2621_length_8402_cov_12.631218_6_plen_305_part_00